MSSTYEKGRQDALEQYGKVCNRQSSCSECMIGALKGDAITCQEFLSQFPSKASALLTEMENAEYTYFDEYVTRFPNCNLPLEELADIICRKAIFEGFVACEGGDCKVCWSKNYDGDVSEQGDTSEEPEESE